MVGHLYYSINIQVVLMLVKEVIRLEFKGVMGGLYKISEWIMRLSVINLLWVLCSSPFVFFLFTKLLVSQQNLLNESITMNWAMGIVAPFTLFPATAAMFTVARKWVTGDVDVRLWNTFFKGFKENYKQSMVGGIFYTLLAVIMYVDLKVYMTQMQGFQFVGIIMIVLLIIMLVSMFNFFSMVVHYHMKTFQLLKNALLITVIRPIRSISTVVVAVVIGFISLRYPFLIVFFAGSVIAAFTFYNFHLMYLKMQSQLEKEQMEKEDEESAETSDPNDKASI